MSRRKGDRDQALIAAVRRATAQVERARAAYEAALLTRDATFTTAMDGGFTSVEVGEAAGLPDDYVRRRTQARRRRAAAA